MRVTRGYQGEEKRELWKGQEKENMLTEGKEVKWTEGRHCKRGLGVGRGRVRKREYALKKEGKRKKERGSVKGKKWVAEGQKGGESPDGMGGRGEEVRERREGREAEKQGQDGGR